MIEKYKTVRGHGFFEMVERKSRFLGHCAYAETEDAALAFIEEISKKHYTANHNCFCYRVLLENEICRQSDDGEPSKTAGLPMLNVLQGEDIRNCVIVVTRYFGGIHLGTGGLVRSYGGCAKQALLAAGILERILCKRLTLTLDYTMAGKIEYEIIRSGHVIENTVYTDCVEYTVLAETKLAAGFVKRVEDISQGTAGIFEGEEVYRENKNI